MLPIKSILPGLKHALRSSTSAVLVAPPGAGKTTRVPLALLDEPWLVGRRILMLEPRRLAARAAASYMAALLGESVGETVGYRVRLQTRVGPRTRIEVITEGILTRMLQSDPALEGTALVIFDEFHERSLHADLGLALCLQSKDLLREDLRILIMSATLEAEPVAALLGDAPVLISEGRSFPVQTHYLEHPSTGRIEQAVVRAVQVAFEREQGDILVFLPGAGEIRRVEEGLLKLGLSLLVAPLHGTLPQEAQDRAIAPGRPGERKVVLSTSIAETSLTVEGVRVIIDSGLMRVPRFSPRTGMTRLETVAVSRASADQRRGRAGRLGPGVCYRLWTEQDDRRLALRSTPEIMEADLAPLALELAAWGVSNPADLRWLDPPPTGALAQARELLVQLRGLNANGLITPHGWRLADASVHPRLAHMIISASDLGHGDLACELAALLSERDIFSGTSISWDPDLRERVLALRSGAGLEPGVRRRIMSEVQQLKRTFAVPVGLSSDPDRSGLLLALAYPDRIGQRRLTGRFLLRNGRGAFFTQTHLLSDVRYLVAAELDDQGPESRIFLAAPVDLAELEYHCRDQIETIDRVAWDGAAQAVRARRQERLGALILKESLLVSPDPEAVARALLDGITEEGLEILPWTKVARQLQERLIFMHRLEPGWPDVADPARVAGLMAPHIHGLKSRADLQRLQLSEILIDGLTWEQRRELDQSAPTHIVVPSGSRIPLDYGDPEAPVLAVRLQEVFGLMQTPLLARGRVPVTLHLLSPGRRPVQVTRDLASFWRTAYFEVRKDLRGRYPKHYWPEDPSSAVPTGRTRPML